MMPRRRNRADEDQTVLLHQVWWTIGEEWVSVAVVSVEAAVCLGPCLRWMPLIQQLLKLFKHWALNLDHLLASFDCSSNNKLLRQQQQGDPLHPRRLVLDKTTTGTDHCLCQHGLDQVSLEHVLLRVEQQ